MLRDKVLKMGVRDKVLMKRVRDRVLMMRAMRESMAFFS